MRETFSVTKDSIQLPYRRFLSDSAAGFILLLIVALSYYVPLFTDVSLRDWLASMAGHTVVVSAEVKVFCLVSAFLLATPLGFVVNAISWVTLGQAIALVEERCFSASKTANGSPFFPVADITASRETTRLASGFGLTDTNCTHVTSLLREALDTPHLAEFAPETQVRGLMILMRNIALFLFCGSAIALQSSDARIEFQVGFWFVMAGFLYVLTHDHSKAIFAETIRTSVILGFVVLFGVASSSDLSARSAILFVAATAVVCVAGVVGYYNCCSVILHAYFGIASVGGRISDSQPQATEKPLHVITEMLRKAAMVR